MAANDYIDRGEGPMCPVGSLASDITHLASTLTVTAFQSADDDVVVGDAALIGDEILKVESVAWPVLGVSRGCADTIPAAHLAGSKIWFFSNNVGTDGREYAATQTVAVKARAVGISGSPTPVANTPPMPITFNWRMQRPYPPGDVRVGVLPWFSERFLMDLGINFLDINWKHRDRLLQADQLIGHLAGDIGPEPGSTYVIRVFEDPGGLRRTVTGVNIGSWQYTRAMAQEDLLVVPTARLELRSVCGGLESLHAYLIDIEVAGLTFAENETEFNFKTAGYAPAIGTIEVNFKNQPYVPPTHQ